MAQGAIDHPSYLTRQRLDLGTITAGSGALTSPIYLPMAIRPHVPFYAVKTAGTTSVNAMQVIVVGTYTLTSSGTSTTTNGTQTLQAVTIGTAAANTGGVGTDMSVTVNAGSCVYLKGATDATAVWSGGFDYTIDPTLGTWSGV